MFGEGQKKMKVNESFAGIDHGTTGIRFATTDGRRFEFSREELREMSILEIRGKIEEMFSDVKLFALSYSMGDGIKGFENIKYVKNRGLKETGGAGEFKGGGTKLFEAMKSFPCVLIPGIHRENFLDPRFKVFSHGASPEKIGLAFYALKHGKNLLISDCSSNTVTLAVIDEKLIGAIDACIFSPGWTQGPIDLEAIRRIDRGEITAERAFSTGGVTKIFSKDEAIGVLAFFCAMEIEALKVLMRDYRIEEYSICIGGGLSENKEFVDLVTSLLGTEVIPLGKWASAEGCAEIAEKIYLGAKEILGFPVNF
jgi:putative methanogenesis marker protein 12